MLPESAEDRARRDSAILDVLKRQLADCNTRMASLVQERGRIAEAVMELTLRRKTDYQVRDRGGFATARARGRRGEDAT